MKLTQSKNYGRSGWGWAARRLGTGELQIALSETARKSYIIMAWERNPIYVENLLSHHGTVEDQQMIERVKASGRKPFPGLYDSLEDYEDWTINFFTYEIGGFQTVPPEKVGALTSATLIGDIQFKPEAEHGDDWAHVDWDASTVWWYPGYQVQSFVDELMLKGEVIFDATFEG